MITNLISKVSKSDLITGIKIKISQFTLNDEMVVRLRTIFFLTAILAFFLAFEMGDDWYVREYANYDWARHIGY